MHTWFALTLLCKFGSSTLEPSYWIDDGCETDPLEIVKDDIQGSFHLASEYAGYPRCCNPDATDCTNLVNCNTAALMNYSEAESACQAIGHRLCTRDELAGGVCCVKGGQCDSGPVWTMPDPTSTSSTTRTNISTTVTATAATFTATFTNASATETTTTSRPAVQPAASIGALDAALAQAIAEEEASMYSELGSDSAVSKVIRTIPGRAVLVAQRLNPENLTAEGLLMVLVEGTSAAVGIPGSLLAQAGEEIVALVTALEASTNSTDSDGNEATVSGMVEIRLSPLSNLTAYFEVSDLPDPVRVTLGTIASDGSTCVFWDEDGSSWSTAGVQTLGDDLGSPVVCATSHLSLFGAILRGFVSGFVCSHATLLSESGISKLATGHWYTRPSVTLVIVLCVLMSALLCAGAALDRHWNAQGISGDQLFLVVQPTIEGEAGHEADADQGRGGTITASIAASASVAGRSVALALVVGAFGTVYDILEPIFEQVIAGLDESCGYLVDACSVMKECYAGDDSHDDEGRCTMMVSSAVVRFAAYQYANVLEKEASSSLFMSEDTVGILLNRAKEAQQQKRSEKPTWQELKGSRQDPSSASAGAGSGSLDTLADQVFESVRAHYREPYCGCRGLPLLFWRLFSAKCPWLHVLRYSVFLPASMSMLLMMTEVYVNMMLAALFFQVRGGALAEDSDPMCTIDDIREKVGQIVAVGMASAVLGGFPGAVISSLHTRDFITCNSEDSQVWKRQLWVWRVRDRSIWIICLGFCSFSLFFTLLFLANVTEVDGTVWLGSMVISTAQATVGIPLVVSLALVCLAMLARCLLLGDAWLRRYLNTEDGDCETAKTVKPRKEEARSRPWSKRKRLRRRTPEKPLGSPWSKWNSIRARFQALQERADSDKEDRDERKRRDQDSAKASTGSRQVRPGVQVPILNLRNLQEPEEQTEEFYDDLPDEVGNEAFLEEQCYEDGVMVDWVEEDRLQREGAQEVVALAMREDDLQDLENWGRESDTVSVSV